MNFPASRRSLATSNPFIPGSMTSSTSRSKSRCFDESNASLARLDIRHLVAFGLEVEPQALGDMQFVFDDQDPAHRCGASGSSMVNVLPRPAPSLSAKALPPCLLHDRLHDEQPEPRPLHARRHRSGNAVEAIEDALELGFRNADALVLYPHFEAAFRILRQLAPPHRRWRPST